MIGHFHTTANPIGKNVYDLQNLFCEDFDVEINDMGEIFFYNICIILVLEMSLLYSSCRRFICGFSLTLAIIFRSFVINSFSLHAFS